MVSLRKDYYILERYKDDVSSVAWQLICFICICFIMSDMNECDMKYAVQL